MAKLTKKGKITIAVSVIVVAVLVFSITMFSIWASMDVSVKKVDYRTLQKKLGNYFIVPSGLENEIVTTDVTDKTCRVYFPLPDDFPNGKHHYGKYTNLTLKYKYATGYSMSLGRQSAGARILATKGNDISSWTEDYDVQTVNGVDVYYKCNSDVDISKNSNMISVSEETSICFVLNGVIYQISTSSGVTRFSLDTSGLDDDAEYARQKADEYARYLFDKMLKV